MLLKETSQNHTQHIFHFSLIIKGVGIWKLPNQFLYLLSYQQLHGFLYFKLPVVLFKIPWPPSTLWHLVCSVQKVQSDFDTVRDRLRISLLLLS